MQKNRIKLPFEMTRLRGWRVWNNNSNKVIKQNSDLAFLT